MGQDKPREDRRTSQNKSRSSKGIDTVSRVDGDDAGGDNRDGSSGVISRDDEQSVL